MPASGQASGSGGSRWELGVAAGVRGASEGATYTSQERACNVTRKTVAGSACGASVRTAAFSRGAAGATVASAALATSVFGVARRTQHGPRAAETSTVDRRAASSNGVTSPS